MRCLKVMQTFLIVLMLRGQTRSNFKAYRLGRPIEFRRLLGQFSLMLILIR